MPRLRPGVPCRPLLVPQWYRNTHPIAYWDQFGHTGEAGEIYARASVRPRMWWYDAGQGRLARTGEVADERLYRPTYPADAADAARHPVRVAFVVVQFAPGGPVERVIAQLNGADTGGTSRVSGGAVIFRAARAGAARAGGAMNSKYRGAQGLDPDFIKKLEVQFGFDKPAPERFALMVWNFARFDSGESYFRSVSVCS